MLIKQARCDRQKTKPPPCFGGGPWGVAAIREQWWAGWEGQGAGHTQLSPGIIWTRVLIVSYDIHGPRFVPVLSVMYVSHFVDSNYELAVWLINSLKWETTVLVFSCCLLSTRRSLWLINVCCCYAWSHRGKINQKKYVMKLMLFSN